MENDQGSIGQPAPVCLAWYVSTTHLLAVDPAAPRPQGLGTVQGALWASTLGPSEALLATWRGGPVLLDLAGRQLLRLRAPGACGASEAAYRPRSVALLSLAAERSTVVLYRLDDAPPILSQPQGEGDAKPTTCP